MPAIETLTPFSADSTLALNPSLLFDTPQILVIEPTLASAFLHTLTSNGLTEGKTLFKVEHPDTNRRAEVTFEEAFKRFEPMFHTVFYRKYHPDILADAKQIALLALYKKWCKDKALLDQTAAFVTTAAIWGISNWRKKEMKRIPHEKPLMVDSHGHVIGASKNQNHRAWSDAIDLRVDLECAIDTVLLKLSDHPDYKHIYTIAHDLVVDVPFTESWKRTGLLKGTFKRYRDLVRTELAVQLAEYRTPEKRSRNSG